MKETRCEVCNEPVDLLADYAETLKGQALSPREYVEYQLTMSDEEKENRQRFFEELFADHEKKKGGS